MSYVYRCYGDNGRLLYVGCTDHIQYRLTGHLRDSSVWLDQLGAITVERFSDWFAAHAAEREAIQTEWPLYNIQHSIEGPRPPHLILQTRHAVCTAEQMQERERRVTEALRAANLLRPHRHPRARFFREVAAVA